MTMIGDTPQKSRLEHLVQGSTDRGRGRVKLTLDLHHRWTLAAHRPGGANPARRAPPSVGLGAIGAAGEGS
jgi:hypothetical protein